MSKSPHVDKANAYARAVIAGEIPACRWVRLACQRHERDLGRVGDVDWPYRFEPACAERVCGFIERLPHVKGKWARVAPGGERQRIVLEGWQCFIVCSLYGWVRKRDGMRRFRRASIYVPRKNAKSTLAAGLGWWMFGKDNEPGSEVYSGASTLKQAMEVFRPARQMALRVPTLATGLGVTINMQNMSRQEDGSRFEPVIGQPGDGASPHCAIIDEYHEHDTSTLHDTMETGMGAREQPLLLIISTAGANMEGPCRDDWRTCEQLLEGSIEDEQAFAIIYTIDKEDRWEDEATWRKANPNFDVSVDGDFLRNQLAKALRSARDRGTILTKHLNLWVGAMEAYFDVKAFEESADRTLKPEDFAGRPCILANDFAGKRDLCVSLKLFTPQDDGVYYLFARYYLPRAQVLMEQNEHFRKWEREGWLTVTDGNVTDFGRIRDDILEDAKLFDIVEMPFDPHQAYATVQQLQEAKVNCVEFPQGWMHFSEPMKEVDKLVAQGRLVHSGDPIMGWALGNVVAKEDTRGNVYPRKERASDKIDPVVALIMATSRAMLTKGPTKSVYEERGVLSV